MIGCNVADVDNEPKNYPTPPRWRGGSKDYSVHRQDRGTKRFDGSRSADLDQDDTED